MLVAERGNRGLHPTGRRIGGEEIQHPAAQLVHVEIGGVDHYMRLRLHRLEEIAFLLDRFGEREFGRGQWMPPTGALITTNEHIGARLEKSNSQPETLGPQLSERRKSIRVIWPGTDDQHDLGDAGAGGLRQFGDLGDQRWREVVDDEPAKVLEDVGSLRPARTRQPGDHHEVAHAAKLVARRSPGDPCSDR